MVGKDIRKEIIKGTIEEFRGPRYGSDELINYNPLDEYLIGVVIPSSWKKGMIDSPDEELLDESDYNQGGDSSTDVITGNMSDISILDPSSQIKSFGLSFLVDPSNHDIDICVSWGRYIIDEESKFAKSLNGDEKERKENNIFWKRKSFGVIKPSIDLNLYVKGGYLTLYDSDDGLIRLYIKYNEKKSHVSIYFRNDLNLSPTTNNNYMPETQDCIFQPSIRISLNNDRPMDMKSHINSSNELDFLYRNKPIFANGHLCSVIWKDIDYFNEFNDFDSLLWPDYKILSDNEIFSKFIEPDLRTDFLPLYPINLPSFDLNEKSDNFELSAVRLAEYSQQELYDNFLNIVDSYDNWISSNQELALKDYNEGKLSKNEFDFIMGENGLIQKQTIASNRIKKGIELIKSEKLVYLAFCFANKTISLQDEWKKKMVDNDEIFNWRVFQIVFILLNLESIWNDKSSDKDVLDLLWIPTGGGKTEAYLGLMAFTMSLRRLKAHFGLSKEKTGAGVSIISRYTLRLLTVQQFRRTLRMVMAAEYLRVYNCDNGAIGWRPKHCSINDNWIYGSVRFSVGMWVGGAVTPLHLKNNGEGAMEVLKNNSVHESLGNPSQIIKCPVCGSWLYVPDEGLTDDKNQIHIVIETDMSVDEIRNEISLIQREDFLERPIDVSPDNHKEGFFTLSFYFNKQVSKDDFKRITSNLNKFKIASLNEYSIGYFSSCRELIKGDIKDIDFEIWCTNPTSDCDLNHFWKEGSPISNDKYRFPDGNYEREIESPFIQGEKIPISAYLIDEHVYGRCPTVIVSTADKIARLAFEPRAGSIFGNVDYYNKYYGYCRNGLFPKNAFITLTGEEYNQNIDPFSSPDLIIQDELHLMNGPLGSLFGLYEVMINALIKKQNGNPKYIASTATINNAEFQSKMLFSKKVAQFPPYGLDISNSYFVRDSSKNIWDRSNKGRVYMGIYAPGLGSFTHQVRLYCRLLKIAQDNKDYKEYIKPYWTIVGYYNAIRELGSALALYKDDMHARIKHISPKNNVREIKPEGDSMELSSRINSTNLPIILDNLERDGMNDPPEFNVLFTTSMFGTGVDISHLSTMVMNGQPKTTGDYIQATGRIGRSNGGLIINLFRPGRPRDLNHYELFSSYHSRIYREVEPVSVSPFSEGCLDKGLGPSIVAFLRNARGMKGNWIYDNAKDILKNEFKDDIDFYRRFLESYLKNMALSEDKICTILNKFDESINNWKKVANNDDELSFVEYIYKIGKNRKPKKNVVLGDPIHEKSDKLTVFKNAPQSLREVEDTIGFWV